MLSSNGEDIKSRKVYDCINIINNNNNQHVLHVLPPMLILHV